MIGRRRLCTVPAVLRLGRRFIVKLCLLSRDLRVNLVLPDSRLSGNPETAMTPIPSMGVGRPIKRRAFPSLVNNHAGKIERATDTAYLTK